MPCIRPCFPETEFVGRDLELDKCGKNSDDKHSITDETTSQVRPKREALDHYVNFYEVYFSFHASISDQGWFMAKCRRLLIFMLDVVSARCFCWPHRCLSNR